MTKHDRQSQDEKSNKTIALVLGGGAPNATLMAGALLAFMEAGVEFDIISTSGAGAIVGLLYVAPKKGDPRKALSQLVGMGISDELYSFFPINFKVFNKPGDMAELWRSWAWSNPYLHAMDMLAEDNYAYRFITDTIKLWSAAVCPSSLSAFSKGLCAHQPFIEEIVDFAVLSDIRPHFYLNAYNLSRREMTCWDKKDITHKHCLAALSFPFIYPPYELNGDYYIEGAAIDTLNFRRLFDDHPNIDTTVVFDVLGSEYLLQPPRNLYDAWVQSIITPLTEIARDDLKLFELLHNKDAGGQKRTNVLRVPYDQFIPSSQRPAELDWSYSNLSRLHEAGYEAGKYMCSTHPQELGLL